jgi:hypothetical protein
MSALGTDRKASQAARERGGEKSTVQGETANEEQRHDTQATHVRVLRKQRYAGAGDRFVGSAAGAAQRIRNGWIASPCRDSGCALEGNLTGCD